MTIFIQSRLPEHAELFTLLAMGTPLGWLERVPTYKDQMEKLKDRDLATYGFLGYPLLQAADILGFTLHVSTPSGYELDQAVAGVKNTACVKLFDHPLDACRGADLVTTDVWTSMGYEAENERRLVDFEK